MCRADRKTLLTHSRDKVLIVNNL